MLTKILVAISFFALAGKSFGQRSMPLSKAQLWQETGKEISDSTRQYYYNQLGNIYLKESWGIPKDIDSAFHYLRKAILLGDSANIANREITNESLTLLASAYMQKNDFAPGVKIFDQVINSYQKTGNKIKKGDTWISKGKYLSFFGLYPEIAENDLKSALSLFSELNDKQKMVDAYLNLSDFYYRSLKLTFADSTLHKALKASANCKSYRISEVYYFLSSVNRYQGNLNQALKYALESVKAVEAAGNQNLMGQSYGELALVYQELNQPKQSIYWYRKCLDIRVKNGDQSVYTTAYFMTVQMIKADESRSAIKILNDLAKNNPPIRHNEKASIFQSLAYCYNAIGAYSTAEAYFLDMIQERYHGNQWGEELMIANLDIGKFYANRQEYKKAKPYLEKAAVLNETTTASRRMELQFLLFKADSAEGNFQAAIQHLEKYKTLNDSIFSVTKSKQIEELLIQYETEKKDQNIHLLEKESKLQLGKLIFANQIRNWIMGFAILFLVVSGLLIYNSRLKQRINKKLKDQQKEIEDKNHTLERLVKEKEWLVKEIHHRVKNNFQMVMGLLGTQSEYLKTEEAINAMTESQHRVQVMSLIHRKLYQSDNLSAINMAHYIHDLVNYLRDSYDIRQSIHFNLQVDPVELDLTYCVPLGLMLNEAITNSIKYAFPGDRNGAIKISFTRILDDQLLLTIKDNGVGFPPNFDINHSGSLGMKLMKGLSEDIDGEFSINGHNGTEIMLTFNYTPDKTNGATH
jgi:two-component sensor histidine kinase/TPR repeat protein